MNWRKPVVTLLLKIKGTRIIDNLNIIKKLDKLSEAHKKKYQKKKLQKILNFAYKNVPYYHKILSKFVVNGNVDLDKFDEIPFLTKKELRSQNKDLLSKDYKKRKTFENTSGGSTGEPVRFIQDRTYDDWNIANKIYYKLKAGQDIGMKELRFWGSERDLLEGKEKFSIRLRNWLYNRREFNTFKMSEKDMYRYVKEWNKYKPSWVESYVQSIYEFAKFISDNGLKIHSPKNGILTSAGTLYPHMKKKIEKVFGCKVYNRYGSREVGDMAFGLDNLYLSFWNHYLEVINGKIYVTTLNNYSMPLIRYEIGDIGELSDDGLSLTKVSGRVNSMIKTSKGNIDSAAITSALYFDLKGNLFTSFSKYQLVQKDKDVFELQVVISDTKKWVEEKNDILYVMKQILGKTVNLKFKEVKHIPSLDNGKYEYIRCEI
ncbi:MAG: hypothetical protein ACOC3Z_01425 [Nanoarchaeota archaeon]